MVINVPSPQKGYSAEGAKQTSVTTEELDQLKTHKRSSIVYPQCFFVVFFLLRLDQEAEGRAAGVSWRWSAG